MTTIMKGSACVVRRELELFSTPPTQVAIESGMWVEHNPISSLDSSSTIEFVVSGSGDDYMDLSRSMIYVKAVILKADGTDLDDADFVAPVNNTLQSLFAQQDIILNDVLVSSSTMAHPYRCYIESLLNGGYDAKESKLSAEFFHRDTNIEDTDPSDSSNKGLRKRFEMVKESQMFDMIGPVHSDVFFQNRFMVSGVSLKIRLTRSKDAFVLSAANNAKTYKLDIKDAKLYVRKVKISPSMILAHEEILKTDTCKYPIDRVEMKVFSISSSNLSYSQDNIFLGQLPNRIVLGLVENTAFNGKYDKNPFEFKHMNLNFLALHLDGQQIPSTPLKPNFDENNSVRAYYTQFIAGDKGHSDAGNCINRDMFADGHALYCFDLTPDLSSSAAHFNLIKTGNLRIEFGFAEPLPTTTNVIILAEFDNIIEVNGDRNVSFDFQN
jgi:hypothetical protein